MKERERKRGAQSLLSHLLCGLIVSLYVCSTYVNVDIQIYLVDFLHAWIDTYRRGGEGRLSLEGVVLLCMKEGVWGEERSLCLVVCQFVSVFLSSTRCT